MTDLKRQNWLFPNGDAGIAVDATDPGPSSNGNGTGRSLKVDLSAWPYVSGPPVGPSMELQNGSNTVGDQSIEFDLKSTKVSAADIDTYVLMRNRQGLPVFLIIKHSNGIVFPIITQVPSFSILSIMDGVTFVDAQTTDWWRPRISMGDITIADGEAYDGNYARLRIDRNVGGGVYHAMLDVVLPDGAEYGTKGTQAIIPRHTDVTADLVKIDAVEISDTIDAFVAPYPFAFDPGVDWRQFFTRGTFALAVSTLTTIAGPGPQAQANVLRATFSAFSVDLISRPIRWPNKSGRGTVYFRVPDGAVSDVRLAPLSTFGMGGLNGYFLNVIPSGANISAKIAAAFNGPEVTVLDMGNVASYVAGDWYGIQLDIVEGVTEPTLTARIEHVGTSPMTQIGQIVDNVSGLAANLNSIGGLSRTAFGTQGGSVIDIGAFTGDKL